jgi:hypothetical protein
MRRSKLTPELRRTIFLRLSEKSLLRSQASLAGCRKTLYWPISCSLHRPNSRSEPCAHPFSDSLSVNYAVTHAATNRISIRSW